MADYSVLTGLLNLSNVKVIHYQLVGQKRIKMFTEQALEVALCLERNQTSTIIKLVNPK